MSWGFFLYVNWFNPGQEYAFYAILAAMARCSARARYGLVLRQAAGYAGFLLFVLRAPNNMTEPRWRPLERALPFVALFFSRACCSLPMPAHLAIRAKTITRAAILFGFVVDLCALGILLARRDTQAPEDYQRVRWVIWGCLIGLPTLPHRRTRLRDDVLRNAFGDFTPSEDIIGLLYLVNGILCLFVFEAIRRERVVSVAIPLRRVTLLGLTLSIPALLLHRAGRAATGQPRSAGLGLARARGVRRVPHHPAARGRGASRRPLFQPRARRCRAEARSRRSGLPRRRPRSTGCSPTRPPRRSSSPRPRRSANDGAAISREENGKGWERTRDAHAQARRAAARPGGGGQSRSASRMRTATDSICRKDWRARCLPCRRSIPMRCFAVSLYGPHVSGTDLDANERAMLARLARDAAAMYAELESSRASPQGGDARRRAGNGARRAAEGEERAWRSMSSTGKSRSFPPTASIGSPRPPSVVGRVQAPFRCQHLVRLGVARRQ